VGRISKVKGVDVLMRAFNLLNNRNVQCTLDVYGEAGQGGRVYYENLRSLGAPFEKKGLIKFHGKIANSLTSAVYNEHAILVNLTPRGNFDKTVLEAMSTETLVAVSSPAFYDLLPTVCRFREGDEMDLADTLEKLLKMEAYSYMHMALAFRGKVIQRHDLKKLVTEVIELFEHA
jgi:glycosyltransferase involved in cell wall biosynthesis